MPSPPPAQIQIDAAFLLRRVSELNHIKKRDLDWNEVGERILAGSQQANKSIARRPGNEDDKTSASQWSLAKGLVHEVITSRSPNHDSVRRSMGGVQSPSTANLLSTLSLWMAGAMGLSTSLTVPMVAVILYAVGQASGNWDILIED